MTGVHPSFEVPERGSRVDLLGTEMDPLTDDALTGRIRILQRKRGHRYSLDDVATAYRACIVARETWPDVDKLSYLDIGCGIGSVLFSVVDTLGPATAIGVEAQAVSFELAQRNRDRNGLEQRVALHHGDLRGLDLPILERDEGFELITGTPPYFPIEKGTASTDAQRAFARMELRGGVEAYLTTMGRLLKPTGIAVLCCDARTRGRVFAAAEASLLQPTSVMDFIPRDGDKGPLFAVWTFTPSETTSPALCAELPPFVARDREGARTEAYYALRQYFGFEPNRFEAPSP